MSITEVPIVCINLARRPQRMAVMERRLREVGFSVQRFDAVDGAHLSDSEFERLNETTRRPLRRGELGCALSHIAVWRTAWEAGDKYIWILEDDVQVGLTPEELERGLSELNQVEPAWHLLYVKDETSTGAFYEVCQAAHIAPELDKANRIEELQLQSDFYRVGPQLGAFSYILSRSGIARCLAGFDTLLNPIDIQLGQLNGQLKTILWRRSDVWFDDDGTSDTA